MRQSQVTGIATAAFFSVTLSAFAQTPTPQTPTPQTPTAAPQTFTGCLMTEPDYRRAHSLGEGTVAGAGLGNEFVLVDVKISPAKATAATATSGDTPAARASASTSSAAKCADQGTAYRLTGPAEGKMKDLVGRHVEIQGRFKDPEDPRTGEKLPNEVVILSFSEAPAPVAVSEPTAPPPPVRTTTPPPPAQTAPPPAAQTVQPPPAQAAPATTPRTQLPRTAGSAALLALLGVLTLSSGVALTMMRRRAL
jgi:hypothetical protein